jgi:hypothetical protein
MSGDSFKPEEGGEPIQVVNPDEGNTEIDAQPEPGDAMDAAESNALKEFNNTSEEDEATEEDAPAELAEDEQAVEAQAEPEPEDEQPAQDSKPAWDGNPDNLPEELQPVYKSMLRGFHQKTREVADERKKFEELNAQLLLRLSGGEGPDAKAEGPPPLPTGDNITQEQWNEAVTAQNQWFAEQNRKAMLEELKESGKFAPAEEVQRMKVQGEAAQIGAELMARDGFTESHAQRVAEILDTDEFWQSAYLNDMRGTAYKLADFVMAEMGARQAKTTAAKQAEDKVKRKATAASRATPRPSTPKGATPENVFATKGFKDKTEDEKMDYAERAVLESLGG